MTPSNIPLQITKGLDMVIGVRAGGARGAAAPPATEITWFFGQNAHDSGNDPWENILQNNAVDVISKTRK